MRNLVQEQAGAVNDIGTVDALQPGSFDRLKKSAVVQLRSERTNVRMQSQGAIEEQTLVLTNSLHVLANDVHQCRNLSAARMGAATRLLELLWVAEQHQVIGRTCGRKHLG